MPSLEHIFKNKLNFHLEANCIKNNFNSKQNFILNEFVESIKLYYRNELQKITCNTSYFFNIITKKLVEHDSETIDKSECKIILSLIDSYIIKSKSFKEFILIHHDEYYLFKNYKDILKSVKSLNTIYCNLIEHYLKKNHDILIEHGINDILDYQTLTEIFETMRDILINF